MTGSFPARMTGLKRNSKKGGADRRLFQMRCNIKLYTTFDADLISLNAAGISVTGMITTALKYRVRGERVHFLVKGCPKYDLAGRKRRTFLTVNVTDGDSIAFLRREIKEGQRSAFFKAIVREALVNQAVGVYYRDERMNRKEAVYAATQDVSGFQNLIILTPGKKKRDYAKEILYGKVIEDTPYDEPARDNSGKMKNRFGDVSDLSLSAQRERMEKEKKKASGKITAPQVPAEKASHVMEEAPVKDAPSVKEESPVKEDAPAAAAGPVPEESEGQGVNEQELMQLFMDM